MTPKFGLSAGDGRGWRPGSEGHSQRGMLRLRGAAMVPGGGAPHQEVQSRWESPSSDTMKTLLRDSSVHIINVTQQDISSWSIGSISCFRRGIREWLRLRSRWVQRFPARTNSRLLRPDDGPLDQREQHAGPQVHTRLRRAERTAVCCGGLRRQHRWV